jgi:hypothetical protein
VVPCFRWLFFVDMSPSETTGSQSVAFTQFLHRPRWPSTFSDSLGTSNIPTLRFSWRSPFSRLTYGSLSLTTCRLARPPVGADQAFTQPTGTFTSGLPEDWSPAPPPDMTTVATGQVPLAGLTALHPLDHQLASLQPRTGLISYAVSSAASVAIGFFTRRVVVITTTLIRTHRVPRIVRRPRPSPPRKYPSSTATTGLTYA